MLLAPDLFLLAPGFAMFLVGAFLTAAAFLPSHGVEIGSLRWQPIFFASIALVLGLQTSLVGLVFMWRRSIITGDKAIKGFAYIRTRRFPYICLALGLVSLTVGFLLDLLLFVAWGTGRTALGQQLPLASLAQSLVLIGGSLSSFALVVMWLHWDERQRRAPTEIELESEDQ
jgi:hypothetical protein